jgi:hypothetical protein
MSWPNKVYSGSSQVYSPDFNDSSLGIHYSGINTNNSLVDSKGLLNLPKTRSTNIKSRIGILRKSSTGMASAGQSAVRNVFPVAAASPITGTFIINPSSITGDQCLAVSTRFSVAPVDCWNVFLSGNRFHIEKYNYTAGADGYFRPAQLIVNNLTYMLGFSFNPVDNLIYGSINSVLSSGFTGVAVFGYGTAGYFYGGYSDISTLYGYNSLIGAHTLYNVVKDAAWFRKEWIKVAQAAQLKTGWGAKVSIANESTAGNFVGNGSTPFEILSGTWKTSVQTVDGELHKVIECVAAGTVWLDRRFMNINSTEASYGSWRGLFYHAPSATPTTVALTATAKATPSVTTGYYFRGYDAEARFGRYNAGVFTDIRTLPAPGAALALAEFHTTRKFNNEWRQNARLAPGAFGPTWTDWQTSAVDTSATYLTSEGMSFTANAGDWLSLGTVRDTYALTKFLGEFLPTEI